MSSKTAAVTVLVVLGAVGRATAQEDGDVAAAADEIAHEQAAPVMEAPNPPPAPEFAFDTGPLPIEFHGYASQGYVISDHNNYFAYKSDKGSFRFTDVALNATSQLTDRLRVVVQIASVINDDLNQPAVRLDFGFVDYRVTDALGFRFGRFRLLTTLYSEVWDTDIARTPIFLPQAVYDPLGRLFFMNANGVQAYGSLRSQRAGSLDYVVSVGSMLPFTYESVTVDVAIQTSGRIMYTTPFPGLRFGGNWSFTDGKDVLPDTTKQSLIAAGAIPANFAGSITQSFDKFYRAGAFAELTLGNWLLAAEYLRMYGNINTDTVTAARVVPSSQLRQDGAYAMTTYRFSDWLTAGAYASFSWPDYRHRNAGPTSHTDDYAMTLRFDLNSYMAIKTEVHRIIGTGGLNSDLNPTTTGNNGWLFAARVSAAF